MNGLRYGYGTEFGPDGFYYDGYWQNDYLQYEGKLYNKEDFDYLIFGKFSNN